MHIVEIYNSTFTELLRLKFPDKSNTSFTSVNSVNELYDIGKKYKNCLQKLEKLKYYSTQILNNNWSVFTVERWIFTLNENNQLIDLLQLNDFSHFNENVIKSRIQEYFPRQNTTHDFTTINEIKATGWSNYYFTGVREEKPYKQLKSIAVKVYDNDMLKMIICNVDQQNNKLHKVLVLNRIKHNQYISTDSFDSYDDSMVIFTISPLSINVKDYNGDRITTFDVTGTGIK